MNKVNQNTGARPSDLKIRNRMLVLDAMRDGRIYTTVEIADKTGISRPTVVKCLQHFAASGLVVSEGKGDSTESGGKKPELYRFTCQKLLLAITLWPNLLSITLCSMELKQITSFKIEAPIKRTPTEAFALIKEKALRILAEYGYDISDLYGVSLSTAGIIDYPNGLLKYSACSPEWGTNIPIRQYMQDIFGEEVELVIENAGKMTGRSELSRQDIGDKRVLVLFSTWGLSACLIEKRHVLNGEHSLIGEVGHMTLDSHDTKRCGCGSYGCAEGLVSIVRIRELMLKDEAAYHQSSLKQIPIHELDFKVLFAQAEQGDGLARHLVAYAARNFASLIRNISLVFDPEIVVFQGDYAHAGAYFDQQLREQLAHFKYYPQAGAFAIEYNTSSLETLDLIGAQMYLQGRFFQAEVLYQE